MTDIFTPEQRSHVMSKIPGQNTGPERAVRSLLHHLGYRFRINRKDLPGKPDIVLPRYKSVIMVHGCFWHHHNGCKFAYTPKSRPEFWQAKFRSNAYRDDLVKEQLEKLGWRVIVVWECELRHPERLCDRLSTLLIDTANN